MYRPYPCDFCENEICLEKQHCKVLDYYNTDDIRYYAGMSLEEAESFLNENLISVETEVAEEMEIRFKARLQQLNSRMINNQLTED